jgi:hypothetical protein
MRQVDFFFADQQTLVYRSELNFYFTFQEIPNPGVNHYFSDQL